MPYADAKYPPSHRFAMAAPGLLRALREITDQCACRLRKGEDSGDRLTKTTAMTAILVSGIAELLPQPD